MMPQMKPGDWLKLLPKKRERYKRLHRFFRRGGHPRDDVERKVADMMQCPVGPVKWFSVAAGFPRVRLFWFHKPLAYKDRLP